MYIFGIFTLLHFCDIIIRGLLWPKKCNLLLYKSQSEVYIPLSPAYAVIITVSILMHNSCGPLNRRGNEEVSYEK